MARATISDEELQLKKRARRRLVGAIALVLIVVVFLPMFLDSEPKPLSQDVAINIPPIPPANPGAMPTPPGDTAAPTLPSQPPAAGSSAPLPPTAGVAPANTRPSAERTAEPGYVVQLGAFSDPAKARQLVTKLKESRFQAYTQTIKTAGGELTRVRVGAYPTKEAAEKARDRLKARKLVIGEASVVRDDS
ncbi:MAG TPA: SPOR domain-containing protein [Burkholderiales bacterium]|jgi:DedD protein|nr:SPOR domain-containing protein [Burkholderiales bacterium]